MWLRLVVRKHGLEKVIFILIPYNGVGSKPNGGGKETFSADSPEKTVFYVWARTKMEIFHINWVSES